MDKKTKSRVWLYVIVFGVALALYAYDKRIDEGMISPYGDTPQGEISLVGEIPVWSLNDLDGNLFKSEYCKGDVVLVNFWATWCPICRTEMPKLKELQKTYMNRDFKVLGVSLDMNDPHELVSFVKGNSLNYRILYGNDDVREQFSVEGVPWSFLIDREGKIVAVFKGRTDSTKLEEEIKRLL